jgi:DNA-directed RNA polymerase subunit RPC12/RpoP
MIVILKCQKCGYEYEKKEEDINIDDVICKYCSGRMGVINLKEIVEKDLFVQAEQYINKWFNTLGIEGTIELIERNKNQACYRIYQDILRKRGLVK